MSRTITRKEVKLLAAQFVAPACLTDDAIESFFISLDTPKSLAACLLYKNKEYDQLFSLAISPFDYLENQADKFHLDYLAVNFLSKAEFIQSGIDKKAVGIAKFLEFEAQCKETNLRFRSNSELENSEFAVPLFVMRRKIDLILGSFSTDEFFENASWGPGVTTLIKGDDTSATRKFQSEIGITKKAYDLMGSSLGAAYPGWFREDHVSESSLSIQAGNTVTTVPKNSKTDRVIAVEPGLNLFFQKSIGQILKLRLGRRGVDLTNQSNNQRLALRGSKDFSLATIDFSSASDSIASNVVRHLLPQTWFTVMNALRCDTGTLGTSTFRWEKFSSMGNGFTFELESLIFYTAALASCQAVGVSDESVSVYGDDVIIPSLATEFFRKFCAFLGFTVNTKKSYSSGVFRESCGSHYFAGIDVKPIFLRKSLTDASSIYKLANRIRFLSHSRGNYHYCDRRFLDTWHNLVRRLPFALRSVRVPYGYGDVGLTSNLDEATPPRSSQCCAWEVLSISHRAVAIQSDCVGLLQDRLTQIRGATTRFFTNPVAGQAVKLTPEVSMLEYGNDVTLRDRTVLSVKTLTVPSWYNLGGWF